MNILKNQKFKASLLINEQKTIQGTLYIVDNKTLNTATVEKLVDNGCVLALQDDLGVTHLINPETLEII